jgi:hypothetical protein
MDKSTYKKEFKKYKKNRHASPERDWTPFRAAEKRYKAKFPPPDFSGVLDLQDEEGLFPTGSSQAFATRQIGIDCSDSRKAYIVPNIPGKCSWFAMS